MSKTNRKPQPGVNERANEFARLHNEFRRKGNTVAALINFRTEGDPDLIYRNARKLAASPFYKPHVLKAPFPRRVAESPKSGFPYLSDYARGLSWLLSILEAYTPELQSFINKKYEVEAAVLHGEYDKARHWIDEIEAQFGISLWVIENRINLLAQVDGQSGVNRYLRTVQYEDGPFVLSYFVSWLSYRAGATVDHSAIQNLIKSHASTDHGIYRLLQAYLGIYTLIDQDKAAEMLYWLDAFPILDKYNLLLLTLQLLASSPQADTDVRGFTASRLAALNTQVRDPQLQRLALSLGCHSLPASIRIDLIDLVDLHEEGRHKEVVDGISNQQYPGVGALTLALRSSLLQQIEFQKSDGEQRSLYLQIREDLAKVFLFSEDGVEARLRLQKIQLNYSNCSWASSLAMAMARQTNNDLYFPPSLSQSVIALRVADDEPTIAFSLAQGGKRYLDLLRNVAPRSGSIQNAQRTLVDEPQGEIDTPVRLARAGQFGQAVEQLQAASDYREFGLVYAEAQLLIVHLYLAMGDVANAADIAASLFVSSRYFGTVLPIEQLIAEVLKHHDLPLSRSVTRGRLSVAIVYDIYSRYISSDYEAHRADAYKDVLKKENVKHASELIAVAERFDRDQLIYFLRYVCVPDVLDQSLALDTTRAVEDERVAILIGLSDLTADNGKSTPAAIKEELREIRTKQVVRDTSARLDQSKIYVNVDAIKRALDITIRESWNRYKFILSSSDDQAMQNLERLLRSTLGENSVVVALNTPTAERRSLFNKMLMDLRDQFTSNKEYGLNSNLSTNIRHGYVLRELRGALVGRELIRNKDVERGRYHENLFWLDKLPTEDVNAREQLSELLSEFSRQIDECIDYINRQLLRIRSDQNPAGLFDYTLYEGTALTLESKWSALETHEEFMDAAFSSFWETTQKNLARVRHVLQNDSLNRLLQIIGNLESDIRLRGIDEFVPGIVSALTMVKSDVRAAVDRVASWFTLSNDNDHQDFEIELALQAGLKTISTYYKNVTIRSETNIICGQPLKGWSLPFFARLFFQILDNAGQHGAADRDELSLDITINHDGGLLFLRVENDLASQYDLSKLQERVAAINSEYGQERAMDLLGEEGGSGYPKIWKLLRTDLKQQHDLVASVVDGRFRIEIVTTMQGII